MKELWSKTFWRDVKKTFDEARADTIPALRDPQAGLPAEAKTNDGPPQVPSPPDTLQAPKASVD
jgi:hypothetical protein